MGHLNAYNETRDGILKCNSVVIFLFVLIIGLPTAAPCALFHIIVQGFKLMCDHTLHNRCDHTAHVWIDIF